MSEAQQARLRAYLDAVQPYGRQLRQRGWPVELNVAIEDDAPVVYLRLAVDDTRVPAESAESGNCQHEHSTRLAPLYWSGRPLYQCDECEAHFIFEDDEPSHKALVPLRRRLSA